MKIKVILLSLISLVVIGSAVAQDIEHDDMYFNSKDRAKLQSLRKSDQAIALASVKKAKKYDDESENPTDSYSARNVNPEFTSRSKSKTAQEDDENYYVNNYRYNNRSNYNNWNNNFNSWYNNPWYTQSYWGSSINQWNSPYYGYYDSWNSPWYDPYWSQNGWSSSFSYYYGSRWNYGWGGSYNYWNRPYCAGNSYYGYGSSYGYNNSNWYWNNYRTPTTYIVVKNSDSGRGIAYGKRPTRGSSVVYDGNNRSRSSSNVGGSNGRTELSGGRSSNNGTRQTEYYDRSWKNTPTETTPTTYGSRSSTQQNRSSWSNDTNNNSSWGDSNRSSSSTPSNSSNSNSSSVGGTRSHSSTPSSGGSSGSSGSNGRTRGRD